MCNDHKHVKGPYNNEKYLWSSSVLIYKMSSLLNMQYIYIYIYIFPKSSVSFFIPDVKGMMMAAWTTF